MLHFLGVLNLLKVKVKALLHFFEVLLLATVLKQSEKGI